MEREAKIKRWAEEAKRNIDRAKEGEEGELERTLAQMLWNRIKNEMIRQVHEEQDEA